eukprot:12885708-Prorocentrum_lima.AAC.1
MCIRDRDGLLGHLVGLLRAQFQYLILIVRGRQAREGGRAMGRNITSKTQFDGKTSKEKGRISAHQGERHGPQV